MDAFPDFLPLQQSRPFAAALWRLGAEARIADCASGSVLVQSRRLMGLPLRLVARPQSGVAAGDLAALPGRGPLVVTGAATAANDLHRAGFLRLAGPRSVAILPIRADADRQRRALDQK